MRLSKIAFAAILGFSLAAQAEENVMVDLSVLDSLGSSYAAPSEPLFPVLPKKAKTSPRKIKKTPSPAEVQSSKPAVKEQKPVVIKKIEVIEQEPVVVVDVEPAPQAEAAAPVVEQKLPSVEEKAPLSAENPIAAESQTTAQAEMTVQSVVEAPKNDVKTAEPADPVKSEIPALLVDETASAEVPAAKRSISFAEGIDELSAEQMAEIDDIVGRFKDVNANKIAIYSYNLDDGVDSFKKKRLSLNRAVEVRGYLIKQGYKNFSIKVVNINSDSDKVNTVELEEI